MPDVLTAGLPNIKTTWTTYNVGYGSTSKFLLNFENDLVTAQKIGGTDSIGQEEPDLGQARYSLDLSKISPIFNDNVDTVQPPALLLIPQIKY